MKAALEHESACFAAEIEAAFRKVPKPTGALSVVTYDDEDTHHFFYGRDRCEISIADLRSHESSLVFFTPSAFHYFLPAFMLAEIGDSEAADVIGQSVLYALERACARATAEDAARFHLLSRRQRRVLARFVEVYRDRYYPDPWVHLQTRDELTGLAMALEELCP